jgi:hypothetical protein
MGVVFLAEDETLGREIALKILDRSIITDPGFEERFRQEAKTVARLQHPNIVPIHALESVDGDLAIDMAYIEGGPLSEVPASVEQVVKWTGDVLGALERCHDSGIVHRDVKPSNILLSLDGRALLSDFGLAKLLAVQQSTYMRSTSSSCMFVGTPRYAPPEAWDGVEPTPAWDVYSVGMVLYEKIAPRYPYDAETPMALLKQILARPIPPLREVAANVSPELSDAIASMLKSDPAERPQDASAAIERLKGTPEFGRAGQLNGSTLLPRLPRVKPVSRYAFFRDRVLGRNALRKAAISFGISVAVLLVILPWQLLGFVRPAAPATLDLSVANVLDTADPAGPSIWPAHWLMEPAQGKDEWRVLACAESHVWMLAAKRIDAGRFLFTGSWAEYSDATARLFQYGDCEGSGRLDEQRGEFAITLTFKDKLDGGKKTRALLVRPSSQPITANDFIARLEKADYVPAILYNELQPRNVAWLSQLERDWLSRVTSIATVPFVDTAKNPIVVDGRLTEPVWQPALSNDTQRLGELDANEPAKASLILRYTSEALYLGIRGEGFPPNTLVEIALLKAFDVHTADSPKWMARLRNGTVVSAMHMSKMQQVPWTCDWQGSITSNSDRWQAEVRIPFEGLAPAAVPHEEYRWRLACNLRGGEGGPASDSLAHWGDPEILASERGIVIVFGSQELGQ